MLCMGRTEIQQLQSKAPKRSSPAGKIFSLHLPL
jgi:hypothetical protein